MHADGHRLNELNELTEKIIGCAYRVGNGLGPGFLEKVYENALSIELAKEGLETSRQFPISITYEGRSVGEYIADLVIEKQVIIEIKAVRRLDDIHSAQCLNYLKATGLPVCLLLNFGTSRVKVKRFINTF